MNQTIFADSVVTDSIENTYFLIGLINRINNSFQACADAVFDELSWKQVFFMNCVTMFSENPTIKDMAFLLGCSHQNAKQLLVRLEKLGYVFVQTDSSDHRKQRIILTDKALEFNARYTQPCAEMMQQIFADIAGEDIKTVISVLTQLTGRIEKIKEKNV